MSNDHTSVIVYCFVFFFSSRRRHTRFDCDWSSDVCSSDLCRWISPPRTRSSWGGLSPTCWSNRTRHAACRRPAGSRTCYGITGPTAAKPPAKSPDPSQSEVSLDRCQPPPVAIRHPLVDRKSESGLQLLDARSQRARIVAGHPAPALIGAPVARDELGEARFEHR